MSATKTHAARLRDAMNAPIFKPVSRPVDVTDAKLFPEMELARLHVVAMRKECGK